MSSLKYKPWLFDKETKEINCISECISNAGAEIIAQALTEENAPFEKVFLYRNNIMVAGAKKIAEALSKNSSLQVLELDHNSIQNEGATALANVLATKNSSLQNLQLDAASIGDGAAGPIATALEKNTSLQLLSLGTNFISCKGTKKIAEALKTNSTLLTLDLRFNRIGNEGAIAIADALRINTSLQVLQIHNTRIRKEGSAAIAAALAQNRTLHYLQMRYQWDDEANEDSTREVQRLLEEAVVRPISIEEAIDMGSFCTAQKYEEICYDAQFYNWKANARWKDADECNRLYLHKAIASGGSWDSLIKHVLEAHPAAVLEVDEKTGLPPAMLAATAVSAKDDFTAVYELLRLDPTAISSMISS